MAGPSHYSLPLPSFEQPVKLLIVMAPFYRDIADQLLAGARATLEAAGATHETIEVPGALEVPTAIGQAYRMANFDGFVALGCVIRGETTHYETVCNDSSRAITLLGLQAAGLISGTVVVETVFSLPGVGRLMLTGVGWRDSIMVQSLALLLVIAVVAMNVLIDILYSVLDPRIRRAR